MMTLLGSFGMALLLTLPFYWLIRRSYNKWELIYQDPVTKHTWFKRVMTNKKVCTITYAQQMKVAKIRGTSTPNTSGPVWDIEKPFTHPNYTTLYPDALTNEWNDSKNDLYDSFVTHRPEDLECIGLSYVAQQGLVVSCRGHTDHQNTLALEDNFLPKLQQWSTTMPLKLSVDRDSSTEFRKYSDTAMVMMATFMIVWCTLHAISMSSITMLDPFWLLKPSITVGVLGALGMGAYIMMHYNTSPFFYKVLTKTAFMTFLCAGLFAGLMANGTNYAWGTTMCQENAKVQNTRSHRGKSTHHYATLNFQNTKQCSSIGVREIGVSLATYNRVSSGSALQVKVTHGFWGHTFIEVP